MLEEKLSVFPMGEKNDAYARYFGNPARSTTPNREEWLGQSV